MTKRLSTLNGTFAAMTAIALAASPAALAQSQQTQNQKPADKQAGQQSGSQQDRQASRQQTGQEGKVRLQGKVEKSKDVGVRGDDTAKHRVVLLRGPYGNLHLVDLGPVSGGQGTSGSATAEQRSSSGEGTSAKADRTASSGQTGQGSTGSAGTMASSDDATGKDMTVIGVPVSVGSYLVVFADQYEMDGKRTTVQRQGNGAQGSQQAAATQQQGTSKQARMDAAQASEYRQVKGEITKLKQVGVRGTEEKSTLAMIRTGDGRHVVADLGSGDEVSQANLKEGEEIMLRGKPVRVDNRLVLKADVARISGQGQTVYLDRPMRRSVPQDAGLDRGAQRGTEGRSNRGSSDQ